MKTITQLIKEACSATERDIKNLKVEKTKYGTWKATAVVKGCKVSQIVRTKDNEEPTTAEAKRAILACYTYPN